MSADIKTAPYQIADQLLLAQESVQPMPELTMSLDEAASMYNQQEFSATPQRASDLRANAPVAEGHYDPPEVQPVAEPAPVAAFEVTKESFSNRVKSRFTKARDSLRGIFHQEVKTPADNAARRRVFAGVAGTLAVGLVMAVGPTSAPDTKPIVGTPNVTTIAQEVRVQDQTNNIADAAGQALEDRAEVVQFVAAHPDDAKNLFTWISTTKAANPNISDAQMNQQFHDYQKNTHVQS